MRASTNSRGAADLRGPPDALVLTDAEFAGFRRLVYEQAGIVLGDQKRLFVCARLGRRLRHHGYATFTEYYEHLMARDPAGEELLQMLNAMTTNKTSFFREEHHFTFLRTLVQGGGGGGPLGHLPRSLRVWSAGCSSGEEPYSIALALLPALEESAWDVKILGTDLDTSVLGHAHRGIYPVDRTHAIPRAVLRRYFLRGRGRWEGFVRVRREVRDLCLFRQLNFQHSEWPVRGGFDCIFCRNVMIYFDQELQQRMVRRFACLLRPGGHLFLGHSESLLGMQAGLQALGRTVYRKPAGDPAEDHPGRDPDEG